jgi:hypothetical protein
MIKLLRLKSSQKKKLKSHQLKNQKNKIFDILINPNLE